MENISKDKILRKIDGGTEADSDSKKISIFKSYERLEVLQSHESRQARH